MVPEIAIPSADDSTPLSRVSYRSKGPLAWEFPGRLLLRHQRFWFSRYCWGVCATKPCAVSTPVCNGVQKSRASRTLPNL